MLRAFFNLFRSPSSSRKVNSRRKAPQPRSTVLGVESLERRELLSATVPGFSLSGGNLYNTAISQTQPIDTAVQNFEVINNTVFDLHSDNTVHSLNSNGSANTTLYTNVSKIAADGTGSVYALNTVNQLFRYTVASGVFRSWLVSWANCRNSVFARNTMSSA